MHAAAQLWSKNLPLDEALHRFTVGEDPQTDRALLPWDAVASAAHARVLEAAGHLSSADVALLLPALQQLHGLALAGGLTILPEQEDAHTALEAALVARCGEAGKRIHLCRSRNDQVILAQRLFLRDRLAILGRGLISTAEAFLAFARRFEEVRLPGMTHLRAAMPSSFGLWGTSMAEGLLEEAQALETLLDRLDRCPGGAAAGFGTPLAYDRELLAWLLGFKGVQRSPLDVINSRGRHEAAAAAWVAGAGLVLEKALWDLALWSMPEFGFVQLPDAFTTGSSIMPQKRNPDVVELGRATCRKLRGSAGLVMELAGGLPSSYHRDQQLLKAPTFALLADLDALLAVLPTLVTGLRVDATRSREACPPELAAAHEASLMAAEGLPFRDAYREVARQLADGTFSPRDAAPVAADLDGPTRDAARLRASLDTRNAQWVKACERVFGV